MEFCSNSKVGFGASSDLNGTGMSLFLNPLKTYSFQLLNLFFHLCMQNIDGAVCRALNWVLNFCGEREGWRLCPGTPLTRAARPGHGIPTLSESRKGTVLGDGRPEPRQGAPSGVWPGWRGDWKTT